MRGNRIEVIKQILQFVQLVYDYHIIKQWAEGDYPGWTTDIYFPLEFTTVVLSAAGSSYSDEYPSSCFLVGNPVVKNKSSFNIVIATWTTNNYMIPQFYRHAHGFYRIIALGY